MTYIIFIFVFFLFPMTETARILAVFPIPSYSHQIVFRPVMQELAKRGHQVTVIATDPAFDKDHTPPNLTEIDVGDIGYRIFNSRMKFAEGERGKKSRLSAKIKNLLEYSSASFEGEMKSKQVQSLIYNETNEFDLLFVESFSRPAISFSALYKVPVIEFGSFAGQFGTYESTGAVTHPLIYPLNFQQRIFNLSVWEELLELYKHYSCAWVYDQAGLADFKMFERVFGSNIPRLEELRKNINALFLSVHTIWDFNRPVPLSVKYLGGLKEHVARKLPKDIQSYLDSSKHGIIYVSFGTNVRPSLLPPDRIAVVTKVLSELPYDVLWKWDEDDLPNCPKNIKISKWFPQSDLLQHPKIKLFITQGGLQSTDEAIEVGVPVLCIPMLWDQWFNGEQYVKHNIGISLSFDTLTEDKLKNAINTLIENQSYRENLKKFRNTLHDKPQTSLEQAVLWAEYVLRNGDDVTALMRAPAANMHWTEYYELELLFIVVTLLIVLLIMIVSIVRCIIIRLSKYYYSKVKMN